MQAKKKYPGQCKDFIHNCPTGEEGRWIEMKSRGWLTIPSDCFMAKIVLWEEQFVRFHGDKIDLKPNPIERLIEECIQGQNLKDKRMVFMASVFVKTRFFHRIKLLNKEAKLKEKIRSGKQQSQFMY